MKSIILGIQVRDHKAAVWACLRCEERSAIRLMLNTRSVIYASDNRNEKIWPRNQQITVLFRRRQRLLVGSALLVLQLVILEGASLRSMVGVSGRQWEGESVWAAGLTYRPIRL